MPASWVRAQLDEVRVGDRISLFCGVFSSVQTVIEPPPKAQRRGHIAWFDKRQRLWVVTLFGPRFLGPPAAVYAEWDLLVEQPLWIERP